jgi:hypothetical protein
MSISSYFSRKRQEYAIGGSGVLTGKVRWNLNGIIIAEDFCHKAD